MPTIHMLELHRVTSHGNIRFSGSAVSPCLVSRASPLRARFHGRLRPEKNTQRAFAYFVAVFRVDGGYGALGHGNLSYFRRLSTRHFLKLQRMVADGQVGFNAVAVPPDIGACASPLRAVAHGLLRAEAHLQGADGFAFGGENLDFTVALRHRSEPAKAFTQFAFEFRVVESQDGRGVGLGAGFALGQEPESQQRSRPRCHRDGVTETDARVSLAQLRFQFEMAGGVGGFHGHTFQGVAPEGKDQVESGEPGGVVYFKGQHDQASSGHGHMFGQTQFPRRGGVIAGVRVVFPGAFRTDAHPAREP